LIILNVKGFLPILSAPLRPVRACYVVSLPKIEFFLRKNSLVSRALLPLAFLPVPPLFFGFYASGQREGTLLLTPLTNLPPINTPSLPLEKAFHFLVLPRFFFVLCKG